MGFSFLFIAIVACQIYGLVKGLTSTLALIICIMSAGYGLVMLGCSPIFGVLWLIIAAYYFKSYKDLC